MLKIFKKVTSKNRLGSKYQYCKKIIVENINWSQCFTRKYNLLFCEGSRNVWKILALNGKTFTSSSKAKACLDVLCRLYCCQCECCIASRSLWKKLSGMEMEKWRLVVLPPSVGDLINHLLCTATCGSKYTEARFSSFFHCCEMKCSSNIHRLTVFSTSIDCFQFYLIHLKYTDFCRFNIAGRAEPFKNSILWITAADCHTYHRNRKVETFLIFST